MVRDFVQLQWFVVAGGLAREVSGWNASVADAKTIGTMVSWPRNKRRPRRVGRRSVECTHPASVKVSASSNGRQQRCVTASPRGWRDGDGHVDLIHRLV